MATTITTLMRTKMLTMSSKPPTDEQLEILEAVKSTNANIMIHALAGTGKTSTLELIEDKIEGPMLCLAFNKRIATEMQRRFKTTTDVKTFNALGHAVWGNVIGKRAMRVEVGKTKDIFTHHLKNDVPRYKQSAVWDDYAHIMEAVGMAKNMGYIPPTWRSQGTSLCEWEAVEARLDLTPTEQTYRITEAILNISIKASYEGMIDFDDQVYMSACFGGSFPTYPLVMVDEKQDMSPVNLEMIRKLVRQARLIGVGDEYQSIYQFRGAAQDGMGIAKRQFDMESHGLTISFRCPSKVVSNVHWRVPHMKAFNQGGHIEQLQGLDCHDVGEGSAIICRNNAPLIRLGFMMLKANIPVKVHGADIGPKIINVLKRLGHADTPQDRAFKLIAEWEERKTERGSSTAKDMADAMRIFVGRTKHLAGAISSVEFIFAARDSTIELLTGHKAKGLEWETVFHLDPGLIKRTTEQEKNLAYVIDTRAKANLYYINSESIA